MTFTSDLYTVWRHSICSRFITCTETIEYINMFASYKLHIIPSKMPHLVCKFDMITNSTSTHWVKSPISRSVWVSASPRENYTVDFICWFLNVWYLMQLMKVLPHLKCSSFSSLKQFVRWRQGTHLYLHCDKAALIPSLDFKQWTHRVSPVDAITVLQWQLYHSLVILLRGSLHVWQHTWMSSRWAEMKPIEIQAPVIWYSSGLFQQKIFQVLKVLKVKHFKSAEHWDPKFSFNTAV